MAVPVLPAERIDLESSLRQFAGRIASHQAACRLGIVKTADQQRQALQDAQAADQLADQARQKAEFHARFERTSSADLAAACQARLEAEGQTARAQELRELATTYQAAKDGYVQALVRLEEHGQALDRRLILPPNDSPIDQKMLAESKVYACMVRTAERYGMLAPLPGGPHGQSRVRSRDAKPGA